MAGGDEGGGGNGGGGGGDVVELLDSGDEVEVVQEAIKASLASAKHDERRRRRQSGGGQAASAASAAAGDAVVVLDVDDEDDDDDEVMVLSSTAAKRKWKPTAGGVGAGAGAAAEEESAWLQRLELPPEACEGCSGTDHVVQLQGCGHGVCLFCLRAPYEALSLTGPAPQCALRCPLANCPRSLLAAADALHLLAPADFDAYAKRRLKAFVAESGAKGVAPCYSCGKMPRVSKSGGGEAEVAVAVAVAAVVGGKRKRGGGGGGGGGDDDESESAAAAAGGKVAAWEKAAAVAPPSPLVMECSGRCNILYCALYVWWWASWMTGRSIMIIQWLMNSDSDSCSSHTHTHTGARRQSPMRAPTKLGGLAMPRRARGAPACRSTALSVSRRRRRNC